GEPWRPLQDRDAVIESDRGNDVAAVDHALGLDVGRLPLAPESIGPALDDPELVHHPERVHTAESGGDLAGCRPLLPGRVRDRSVNGTAGPVRPVGGGTSNAGVGGGVAGE